jgi:putative glutamine amidotransferase
MYRSYNLYEYVPSIGLGRRGLQGLGNRGRRFGRYWKLMPRALKVALPFGTGSPEEKRVFYREALRALGVETVEDAAALADLDGLLLAGGNDIDPALYGETRRAQTEDPDPDRDRRESALLREAIERDLPVLAICRGLQLLNVVQGGTLIQHVEGHSLRKLRDAHAVSIAAGSRLEAILGTREYVVNSRHHQCAGRVAPGLVATALAPDGVVEGLELAGRRFILGVQWHPEARTDGPDAKLFAAFRDAMLSRYN